VNSSLHAGVVFRYPKDEEERFAAMAVRVEDSLKLPAPQPSDKAIDTGAFSLKNGRVYKGKTELDCEVYDVPAEVEGSIRHWSAFGTDTSDAVSETETGVWFFGGEGEFMTFIPLESEYEYQDIVWSPSGDRLVLVRGSGVRADMFFELYAEGMERKAEFSGVRGSLVWLDDGMRFVFTRIDGTRDEAVVFSIGTLRLSAVLYDSAIGETTVLKEATGTQNFYFSGISGDGENIAVSEEYVETPGDWADEGKIKNREISVPIPAAG
jgi:hypothetical protein